MQGDAVGCKCLQGGACGVHMLGLSGTWSYAVYLCIFNFVYSCICIFIFSRLTHGNIIFDILEQSSCKKYAICWVFRHSIICYIFVFVYLYLCMSPLGISV